MCEVQVGKLRRLSLDVLLVLGRRHPAASLLLVLYFKLQQHCHHVFEGLVREGLGAVAMGKLVVWVHHHAGCPMCEFAQSSPATREFKLRCFRGQGLKVMAEIFEGVLQCLGLWVLCKGAKGRCVLPVLGGVLRPQSSSCTRAAFSSWRDTAKPNKVVLNFFGF